MNFNQQGSIQTTSVSEIKAVESFTYLRTQWAKLPRKQSEGARLCINSALKIQCHIVKNTHLQTAFSAILPTGKPKWINIT